MKMVNRYRFVFSVAVLLPTFLLLAPLPTLFLINRTSEECALMSSGDEFTRYYPPSGWEEVSGYVETEYGSCDYDFIHDEECCELLGYKFIGYIDGIRRISSYSVILVMFNYILPFGLIILLGYLTYKFILKSRRSQN